MEQAQAAGAEFVEGLCEEGFAGRFLTPGAVAAGSGALPRRTAASGQPREPARLDHPHLRARRGRRLRLGDLLERVLRRRDRPGNRNPRSTTCLARRTSTRSASSNRGGRTGDLDDVPTVGPRGTASSSRPRRGGSNRIRSAILQVLSVLIADGMPIADAVERARGSTSRRAWCRPSRGSTRRRSSGSPPAATRWSAGSAEPLLRRRPRGRSDGRRGVGGGATRVAVARWPIA